MKTKIQRIIEDYAEAHTRRGSGDAETTPLDETKFNKTDFDRLRASIYRDVVYLKETNPNHFTIVDGHGTIGQAISDKVNLIPVWFEKRNGTVEKFNLNLTTYRLEPINGDSSS